MGAMKPGDTNVLSALGRPSIAFTVENAGSRVESFCALASVAAAALGAAAPADEDGAEAGGADVGAEAEALAGAAASDGAAADGAAGLATPAPAEAPADASVDKLVPADVLASGALGAASAATYMYTTPSVPMNVDPITGAALAAAAGAGAESAAGAALAVAAGAGSAAAAAGAAAAGAGALCPTPFMCGGCECTKSTEPEERSVETERESSEPASDMPPALVDASELASDDAWIGGVLLSIDDDGGDEPSDEPSDDARLPFISLPRLAVGADDAIVFGAAPAAPAAAAETGAEGPGALPPMLLLLALWFCDLLGECRLICT